MNTQLEPQDERKGLPSASSAERWVNCPDSHYSSMDIIDMSSDDADEGTMLHEAVAFEQYKGLTEEQTEACKWAVEKRTAIKAEVFGADHQTQNSDLLMVEERLWRDQWSGKPDYIEVAGSNALILDYKFGRGDVAQAENNLQLAALAVLAHDQRPFERATLAIVQPRLRAVSVAYLSRKQIAYARAMLDYAAAIATKPNQPRKAGNWCKYCPMKKDCPEHRGLALATVSYDLTQPERMAQVLNLIPEIRNALDLMEERAHEALISGVTIPGYGLGDCKPSLKGVELAVRQSKGLKGKALAAEIDELLGGISETKEVVSKRRNILDAGELVARLEAGGITGDALKKLTTKVVAVKGGAE